MRNLERSTRISFRFMLVAIFVVALMLGCMFEPGNETALRSRGVAVTFSGVALSPRASITLEASASPNGPFAVIATVAASGVPTRIGGALLYRFSTSAVVPSGQWAQTCTGSETFARARGGDLVLTVYDSAAIAGVSGEECVEAEIADGAIFPFAARNCASEYGAPVRLKTPEAPLPGTELARNLRIVNPYQADDYACLTSVDGDLRILDPSNTDLELSHLETVSGDLEVRYSRDLGDTKSRLVDLPALVSVGGDVVLQSLRPAGPNPGGPLTIELGMPALAEVGGALSIEFEGAGAGFDSVRGLAALTSHAGDLTIRNRFPLDTSYPNLLAGLTEVGGDATLLLGLTSSGVLEALEHVEGDFTLEAGTLSEPADDLAALASIGGDALVRIGVGDGGELSALATVGGSLALRYGTAPAQPTLANLASIGGELRVFESFAVAGDAPLSVGSLELDANPGLTELVGTLSHVSVAPSGPIVIIHNPNISDCEAQVWADGLVGHVGPVTIADNDSC